MWNFCLMDIFMCFLVFSCVHHRLLLAAEEVSYFPPLTTKLVGEQHKNMIVLCCLETATCLYIGTNGVVWISKYI